ncbi:glycosyltransferase [Quadrisphaera setariae]
MTIPRKRRPSVISVHHWPLDRYPNWVQALLRFRWLRPRRVIEVSVADDLVEGSTVIYNPVPRGESLRDSGAGVLGPSFDLIAVARHSHEKGLDTLINALGRLPDRHLTLFGSGALTEDLVKLAQNTGVASRVTFAGSRPRPDVLGAMSRCRTLVMPSRWEAMPMSLLEAVSVDSPIVLSDIAAHQRFIEFGAGVPFRVDDDVDLANAIEACGRAVVQAQLVNGRSRLRAEQSESVIGRSWLSLVKSQGGVA